MQTRSNKLKPEAESPLAGRWLTENEDAVIEMFQDEGDKFSGRLVWIANPPPDGSTATDGLNPDPQLRERPLCGLTMLGGFVEEAPNQWNGGWIYSPDEGRTYSAALALASDDALRVRGFIGLPIFGKSQTWSRVQATYPPCGQVKPKRSRQ